jgi:hypothetical protein
VVEPGAVVEAAALWSAVLPVPTVLEGVWPVTGGLAVCPAVWSGALLGVVPAACPVAPALAVLAEPVASADGLLTCADAPPMEPEAC